MQSSDTFFQYQIEILQDMLTINIFSRESYNLHHGFICLHNVIYITQLADDFK